MKQYLTRSSIQATVIGLVIFLLECAIAGPEHAKKLSIVGEGYFVSAVWCIVLRCSLPLLVWTILT